MPKWRKPDVTSRYHSPSSARDGLAEAEVELRVAGA